MTDQKQKDIDADAVAPAPSPCGDGAGAAEGPPKRWSSRRKADVVRRLIAGETLEALSREMNVPVHKLAQWRDQANQALESAFSSRDTDPRDAQIRCLTSKIGQMTMEAKQHEEKIARLEDGHPSAIRRSRK